MRSGKLGAALFVALAFGAVACSSSESGSGGNGISGGTGTSSGGPSGTQSSYDASGVVVTPPVSGSNASAGAAGASGSVGASGADNAGSGGASGIASSGGRPPTPVDAGAIATSGKSPDAVDASAPVSAPPHDASTVTPPARDASMNVGALPPLTLWVAGDSTASVYGPASAQQGWGEHLADFLNAKVTVNDQAFPGRTAVTFMASSHWTTIANGMKAGDYVMIEFGINDSSTASNRLVSIADFTTTIAAMVDAVLAKKATPIMVTPSALQYWTNGVETNAREQPYADAMKAVAMQKNILVDDLNALSVAYLNVIGQTAAAQIYINGDKAHFTLAGATQMAKLITQALVTLGSPLGNYVN